MITNTLIIIAISAVVAILVIAFYLLKKKVITHTQGTIVAINPQLGTRGYKNGKPSQEWIQPYTIFVELVISNVTEIVPRKLKVVAPYEDRHNAFSYIPFRVGQTINVGVEAVQPHGFTILPDSEHADSNR